MPCRMTTVLVLKALDKADLILMGVSRSGKTPTCLYLAMQYKVLAANYPLTEDDFMEGRLPEPLKPFKEKLVWFEYHA